MTIVIKYCRNFSLIIKMFITHLNVRNYFILIQLSVIQLYFDIKYFYFLFFCLRLILNWYISISFGRISRMDNLFQWVQIKNHREVCEWQKISAGCERDYNDSSTKPWDRSTYLNEFIKRHAHICYMSW